MRSFHDHTASVARRERPHLFDSGLDRRSTFPIKRRNSPKWGVSTHPGGIDPANSGRAANIFNASASITIGIPHDNNASKARTDKSCLPHPAADPYGGVLRHIVR